MNNSRKKIVLYLKKNSFVLSLLAALIIIYVISIIASPYARGLDNLLIIISRAAIIGVAAFGATFVLANGGIDLSGGSIIGFCAVVTVTFISRNVSLPICIIIGILTGLTAGFINGLIVTKLKVVPFIATLAMMLILRGAIFPVTEQSGGFLTAMDNKAYMAIFNGNVFGIPIIIIIFILLFFIFHLILVRTKIGTYTLAIGGNKEAARISGIRIDMYTIVAYSLAGIAAGVAGVLLGSRTGIATRASGLELEFPILTAIILGGTPIGGGLGTIIGTFIGALIMESLTNLLHLVGIAGYYEWIFKGGVFLLAVYLTDLSQREKI